MSDDITFFYCTVLSVCRVSAVFAFIDARVDHAQMGETADDVAAALCPQ
jgi:hypothetical protein